MLKPAHLIIIINAFSHQNGFKLHRILL